MLILIHGFMNKNQYTMKKIILSLSMAIVLVSCAVEQTIPSQVNVKQVAQLSNAKNNVLLYSLPTTVVRVNVEVEKNISKVGPFYRYSKKMLNVTDVVKEDKVEWRIKSVNIETFGIPDNEKQYAISFSGASAAPLVNITPEGVLAGINTDVVNQKSYLKDYTLADLPNLEDVNFNNVAMIEKQLVKTSTAAMAQETANYIYKIRKRRFKILASDFEQLPPDGQSYEVMVRELNTLEKEHLELFVGKTETFTTTHSFDLIPNELSVSNEVLFRFSALNGIVDKMDVSGAPVYYELKVEDTQKLPNGPIVSDKKGEVRNGLFYCKPGKAVVKIIDKNVLIKEQEVFLGQYGQTISMPSNVLEQGNVSIQLNPATGALQSIYRQNNK